MISFENGPTFIFNRFNTLEEAQYVIDAYSKTPTKIIDYYINSGTKFYLETEE